MASRMLRALTLPWGSPPAEPSESSPDPSRGAHPVPSSPLLLGSVIPKPPGCCSCPQSPALQGWHRELMVPGGPGWSWVPRAAPPAQAHSPTAVLSSWYTGLSSCGDRQGHGHLQHAPGTVTQTATEGNRPNPAKPKHFREGKKHISAAEKESNDRQCGLVQWEQDSGL